AGLVGDVRDATAVEALAREDAHRGVEDRAALVQGGLAARRGGHQARTSLGHSYTSGRRCARRGSLARTSSCRAKSRSATTTASSRSPASASTAPHGSTINERPPDS